MDKGYEKAAHLYDIFDNKNNINFFYKYAKAAKTILDIGAGTGRIAIPLAERGVKVISIEPSPAMRNVFVKKLEKKPNLSDKIILIKGNAHSFKLDEFFPAAFLSGTFDHFSDDDRLSSLHNINLHLKMNGKLIFDVFIGSMDNSPVRLVDTVKKGDLEYHRYIGRKVRSNNRMEVRLIFETYREGELIEKIEQKSNAYTITREEVHQALEKTGFKVKKEFGNYNKS